MAKSLDNEIEPRDPEEPREPDSESGDQSDDDDWRRGDRTSGPDDDWRRGDGFSGLGDWRQYDGALGLGYHSDTPDCRDLTIEHAKTRLRKTHAKALEKSYLLGKKAPTLPKRIDLRDIVNWPAKRQGPIQSCTAHAVTGLIEYMIWQRLGVWRDLSRLFLYKVSRRLLHWDGDSGATLRAALKASTKFGIPPERQCPYNIRNYDLNPDVLLFGHGQEYRAIQYTRLDDYGLSALSTLERVKRALCDRIPVAFGFPVYDSVTRDANIPTPRPGDGMCGGHAVLAVGFHDDHFGKKKGALIVRNSWGRAWGEQGYGYLPYKYVEDQLAVDFWTVLRGQWLHPHEFGLRQHPSQRGEV